MAHCVSRGKTTTLALTLAILGLTPSTPLAGDPPFEPGETVARVEVQGEPGQSYALYLPPDYSAERAWPTLYCFDPRGHGMLCLELFREAAERYGYIVASSNNSRSDGPMEPNIAAMKAIWKDTHARLSVDDDRFYTTGFSGGARVANILAQLLGGAGVIACGAGFPPSAPPTEQISFPFYAMVGRTDFNYYEVRALADTLASLKIPHRLSVFEGGHTWAPAERATRAMEWMELWAMRTGKLARDESWIASQYQGAMRSSAALEASDRPHEAWLGYQAVVEDFAWCRDVTEAQRAVARLAGSKPVKAERKLRRRWDGASRDYLDRLPYVLESVSLVDKPAPTLPALRAGLRLSELLRQRDKRGTEEALAATRLLEMVHVQASFVQLTPLWQAGEYARAALLLAVAAEIKPERVTNWYNLACAHALQGETGPALDALERAVRAGYRDLDQLLADADLESIRRHARYRAIVEGLRSRE